MKKIISAFIFGVVISTTFSVFGEALTKNIEAIFGKVQLTVDGKNVDKETLLYNGTTYVPLRAVSEMFGMTVDFDPNTSTAKITSNKAQVQTPPPPVPSTTTSNTAPKKNVPETPVTIDQIKYNIRILPPNSIGMIFMETEFKNNTPYTLSCVRLTYIDKSINDKQYLSTYDTLLPGETSTVADTFGPTSGSASDLQLIETQITILKDDGDRVYVTYDHKTQKYSILGKM